MLASTCPGGRRLVLLIRRAAATAAAGKNRLYPQPSHLPDHCYSSKPLARTPDPDAASYLVASCGLAPAAAASLASRSRIRSAAKADEVLALLHRHGFSDALIARMLPKVPHLLSLDPDKIVGPKLEFFAALGVRAAVVAQTNVLGLSLDKHIIPFIEFIRGVLGTDASIRRAVSGSPSMLGFNLVKKSRPALEALRRHGLTEEAISKLLSLNLGVLRMAPSRIGDICKDVEALGLPITDFRIVYSFWVMSKLKKENWLRKVALYQSLGVSRSGLLKALKTRPMILLHSDENIKKKVRFFLDELKFELRDVMEQPVLIGYSLEKTIIPRCAVLSVLMREGKIQRDINLSVALATNCKVFSKRYVLKHADDVPDVVKAYEGKIKFEGFRNHDVY